MRVVNKVKSAREFYTFDPGKFQKSARETLMLPVANSEIKKFHGQQKISREKKNNTDNRRLFVWFSKNKP